MRKIKKINGYLVVKFNDRELREWANTALGNYGVIDAELYTGCLDIDRSVMEYDGAETLEEAIEQARGLESELEVDEPVTTYTLVIETDESTQEEEVEPKLLAARWETALEGQIASRHYPDVTPSTARHQLYGFKMALNQLGLLDSEDCFVLPATFDEFIKEPVTFAHLPPEKRNNGTARGVYALGLLLEEDCPQNDCRLYLNIFSMCRELDEQASLLTGRARVVVEADLRKQYFDLETMFITNYAIREYRRESRKRSPDKPSKETEPPVQEATPRSATVFVPYKCPDMRGLRLFLEEWQQENRAHRSWLEKSFQCFLDKWERDRGF